MLLETEFVEVIFVVTSQYLASLIRFTNGALSILYKLRYYGCIVSMNLLITLILRIINSYILHVPPVYPIPKEMKWQKAIGMEHYLIGELITTEIDGWVVLRISPNRHCSFSGPFRSIREYLRAYIKSLLIALEMQQGIKEYKERFLERIKDFVKNRMHKIPTIVEDIPIVAMHADIGLHNVIVSNQTKIKAMLFRRPAPNGFGPEYYCASELREAFWGTITDWKQFGLFMKPEWRPKDLPEDEIQDFWRENIRVVESTLDKYS
ncbi:hypothetical protein K469DRAFT_727996 [Zopfia rhizophila CBS 207.26]|uniref:Aminoglycoside phosphotransferase domain-containing protein n=1 Tax=Zopfia rhizophila CBS 207.26 TaxID=1314779 RepID=A0A6A6DXE8_9PEZI|nr:hypothetical protein K469DRAFT_727996 [Zopfia rhizophila CBS 207.26]